MTRIKHDYNFFWWLLFLAVLVTSYKLTAQVKVGQPPAGTASTYNITNAADEVYLTESAATMTMSTVAKDSLRKFYTALRPVIVTDAPFNAHPDSSGDWNTDAFQAAVDSAASGAGGGYNGYVIIPPLDNSKAFTLEKNDSSWANFCVVIPPNVRVKGYGGSANNRKSQIKLADTQNCWVFYNKGAVTEDTSAAGTSGNEFWHASSIEDIRIDLNGSNNATFAGAINISAAGETSFLRGVYIVNARNSGAFGDAVIRVKNPAPFCMENISMFPLTGVTSATGFLLDGGVGYAANISGDRLLPFIKFKGGRWDVHSPKIEYNVSPGLTDPVILSDSAEVNSSLTITGGYINAGAVDMGIAIYVDGVDQSDIPQIKTFGFQATGLNKFFSNQISTADIDLDDMGQDAGAFQLGAGMNFHQTDDMFFTGQRVRWWSSGSATPPTGNNNSLYLNTANQFLIQMPSDVGMRPSNAASNTVTYNSAKTTFNQDAHFPVDTRVYSKGIPNMDGTLLIVSDSSDASTNFNPIFGLNEDGIVTWRLGNGDGINASSFSLAGGENNADIKLTTSITGITTAWGSEGGVIVTNSAYNTVIGSEAQSSDTAAIEIEPMKDDATYNKISFADSAGQKADIISGADTPEGTVTADVGSIFLRNNGASGTTLYLKSSGTGNTGWETVGTGGSGQNNTVSNLTGAGVGIYKDQSGVDSRLKRLKGVGGVTITDQTDSVEVSITAITEYWHDEYTVTNAENRNIFFTDRAITITKVGASTDAGTVTLQLVHRDVASPNSGGTSILSASLVADNNNEETTSFADATVPADRYIVFTSSAIGSTPGEIRIYFTYTVD